MGARAGVPHFAAAQSPRTAITCGTICAAVFSVSHFIPSFGVPYPGAIGKN